MKFTEQGFNRFIAAGQWSSSWFIASAFLLVLLDAPVPAEWSGLALFIVSVTAPLFLTVGMYQVWRLPDARRWLAVPAVLVLLASGALMFSAVLERNRDGKTKETIEMIHKSAAWKIAESEFSAAMDAYKILAARTFPADYPQRFEQNEAAKTKQWKTVQEKSAAMKSLEPAVSLETRTSFDIFGTSWAWVVASAFLVLYELANHSVAMALAFKGKETAPKTERSAQTAQTRAAVFGVDEYLEAARRLGKDGVLAGYRQVSEDTGQSAYRCRELFGEALRAGRIKKKEGTRGAREEGI